MASTDSTEKVELTKDLGLPERDPPPYIVTQQGANNSDTILSLPVVLVTNWHGSDVTEPLVKELDLTEKTTRRAFIKKVYCVVLAQVLFTGIVITWFVIDSRLQCFIEICPWAFLGVMISLYISTAIAMMCFEAPRRRVPYNYVCLLFFTIAAASLLGFSTSFIPYEEVLLAAAVSFIVVLFLTLFAFQTRIDFTLGSDVIICLALVLGIYGILVLFTPFPALHVLCVGIIVLLMSLHLVYNTQLMISGKHRYAISSEEYIFAAFTTYLNITYIFVEMLHFFNKYCDLRYVCYGYYK